MITGFASAHTRRSRLYPRGSALDRAEFRRSWAYLHGLISNRANWPLIAWPGRSMRTANPPDPGLGWPGGPCGTAYPPDPGLGWPGGPCGTAYPPDPGLGWPGGPC